MYGKKAVNRFLSLTEKQSLSIDLKSQTIIALKHSILLQPIARQGPLNHPASTNPFSVFFLKKKI
jgi:hypothetical protein